MNNQNIDDLLHDRPFMQWIAGYQHHTVLESLSKDEIEYLFERYRNSLLIYDDNDEF